MAEQDLSPTFFANGNLRTDSLYVPATGTGHGHVKYDPDGNFGDLTTAPVDGTVQLKRGEITDYIRLRLADGIVDVELDTEHYNLAVDQAVIKYRQRAANS